jgi:hypothetical protein
MLTFTPQSRRSSQVISNDAFRDSWEASFGARPISLHSMRFFSSPPKAQRSPPDYMAENDSFIGNYDATGVAGVKLAAESPLYRYFPDNEPRPPGAVRALRTRSFERPPWKMMLAHIAICTSCFPIFYILLPRYTYDTLYMVRSYVSLATTVASWFLGFTLLALSRRWFEAAGMSLR